MGSSVVPSWILLIPETCAYLNVDFVVIMASGPHVCQRFEVAAGTPKEKAVVTTYSKGQLAHALYCLPSTKHRLQGCRRNCEIAWLLQGRLWQ